MNGLVDSFLPHDDHDSIVMTLKKPDSLEVEHHEIHSRLAALVNSKGKTAEKAKKVEDLLQHHFEKEEELSIPVLGALRPSLEGKLTRADAKEVGCLSKKFKARYRKMLSEHVEIVRALEELDVAAKKEKRDDALEFSEALRNHARTEEEVLYPATVLLGNLISK